ncbi:MAG TPA: hypothetical protein DCZ95_19760 [Verrucomicrobia bacterium]|nr:MAG: hypothetical protein A2X46_10990 [Lentisphaerae bacterium GWF2_57_35]HBA86323.1 hypothetical protein [Verrucomicrobiota bacterium]
MIALYKGKSTLSRAIRWRTWSEYSHAAWVLDDGSVIEAWKGGVRHVRNMATQHTPGTDVDLFTLNLTVAQKWAIQDFLIRQVGKPYDYGAILGFMTRAKSENSEKWFCSELIFAACQSAGVELLKRIPAWKVSPGLLSVSACLSDAPSQGPLPQRRGPLTWDASTVEFFV